MSIGVRCPKCGSYNIHADKKGFSIKKSIVGGLLAGPVGLLAGAIGSNKIRLSCLNCGYTFKPGENSEQNFTPTYIPCDVESTSPRPTKGNKTKEQRVRIGTLLKYRDVIKESKVKLLEDLLAEGTEFVIIPSGEIECLCKLQKEGSAIKRILSFREADV